MLWIPTPNYGLLTTSSLYWYVLHTYHYMNFLSFKPQFKYLNLCILWLLKSKLQLQSFSYQISYDFWLLSTFKWSSSLGEFLISLICIHKTKVRNSFLQLLLQTGSLCVLGSANPKYINIVFPLRSKRYNGRYNMESILKNISERYKFSFRHRKSKGLKRTVQKQWRFQCSLGV